MSARPRRIAVVGGGIAAATACETLRGEGYDGHLVLVGAERHLPYERPPLSKGYLLGTEPLEKAFVHDAAWYADHDVDLRLGRTADALDPETHVLAVAGEEVPYDRLLIATGAEPRRLPMADDSRAQPVYLRNVEDSNRLQGLLQQDRRIVVLGAGWIGLEVASAARAAGCEVVVVEPAAQPLLRVLGVEVGTVFADLHREHGVDLRLETRTTAIARREGSVLVTLSDGTVVGADALVVGIGATPRDRLAEASGLAVENGVLVDEQLRTSHPDVFAAGDVANAYHPALARHLRVEHWDNAIEQARAAARNMLGAGQVYDRLPYFFSDQYDLGMEYVGVTPDGYDEVVIRGDLDSRIFTALWLKDGTAAAGMHANDWDATEHLRRVLDSPGTDASTLRDPRVPVEELGR